MFSIFHILVYVMKWNKTVKNYSVRPSRNRVTAVDFFLHITSVSPYYGNQKTKLENNLNVSSKNVSATQQYSIYIMFSIFYCFPKLRLVPVPSRFKFIIMEHFTLSWITSIDLKRISDTIYSQTNYCCWTSWLLWK